jgi:formylglycine-generating enzyme required for sulfatase activity
MHDAKPPKGRRASGSYRVLRGGSWNLAATACRVAHRDYDGPENRHSYGGFRVLLSQ